MTAADPPRDDRATQDSGTDELLASYADYVRHVDTAQGRVSTSLPSTSPEEEAPS